jgi:Cof subfamily protein (haloacid dehalogenase superfamily)
MIKAIILDVDGVIVGEKKGFNFPQPHPKVLARLREIKQKGIPISLCTAKPSYAAEKIIDDAQLDNVHITMAGAVIIDPIDKVVLHKYTLPNDMIQSLIDMYLSSGVYIEVYTTECYFVQADQVSEFTNQRIQVLQTEPTVVQSLTEAIADKEVVKVMPVAADEKDKVRVAQLFKPYQKDLTLSWTIHPFTLPHQYGNVTAQGISKRQAVATVADSLHVQAADILGVGDGMADWQFIELCGYGAAMGNADEELKQLVAAKGSHGYTGPSVDEHGILDIFDHFKL